MSERVVSVSNNFKKQTFIAFLSILVFFLIYFSLLALAGLMIWGLFELSIIIISIQFHGFLLLIGLGAVSFGVLIFIFLLKFLLVSIKEDRSGLQEIFEEDHPALFAMIRMVAYEVNTSEPKHVYISPQVNASVFYDSTFWSMFLPIKKNLHIGIGLVNAVTHDEFKAILAHEFGHFSQRSMRLGSYVSTLNRRMYNMLYENEGFLKWTQDWAEFNGIFAWFVQLAVYIIQGVQWLMRQLYTWVYKGYMALSREMEFHADEMAAAITGSEPLKTGLLRSPLADDALNQSAQFYGLRNGEKTKSGNLFYDQKQVMAIWAQEQNYPLMHGLPIVAMEDYSRYNKSRLVIKDQWSSHPTTEERIQRLDALNWKVEFPNDGDANSLFTQIEDIQKHLTEQIYATEDWADAKVLSSKDFLQRWTENREKNKFPEVFNGYYNARNVAPFDLTEAASNRSNAPFSELFSDAKVNMVYQAIALEKDISIIMQIADPKASIRFFDYDGQRYKSKQAAGLAEELQKELVVLQDALLANDRAIYAYFLAQEQRLQRPPQLTEAYQKLQQENESWKTKMELVRKFHESMAFLQEVTPYEVIERKLAEATSAEEEIKRELRVYMSDALLADEWTKEMREIAEKYTNHTLTYFVGGAYNEEALSTLQQAVSIFEFLVDRHYFVVNKGLLQVQAELC